MPQQSMAALLLRPKRRLLCISVCLLLTSLWSTCNKKTRFDLSVDMPNLANLPDALFVMDLMYLGKKNVQIL